MTTAYPTTPETPRLAQTERGEYTPVQTNRREVVCRGTLWTRRAYCSTLKAGEALRHAGTGRYMCPVHWAERNYIEANYPRQRDAMNAILFWLHEHARMAWQNNNDIGRLVEAADPFGHVAAEGIQAALENLTLEPDELLEYGEIYDLARTACAAALDALTDEYPTWLDDPEETALRNQELRQEAST